MLRAAPFTLRHLRTPSLGGVRRLCSSQGGGASPNCNCACCSRSKKMLSTAAFTLRRHIPTPSLGGVRGLCSSSSKGGASPNSDSVGNFYYSETEARELFEIWCKKYGKTYPSEEDKLFRFGRFRGTLEFSLRENQKIDNPEHRKFGTYSNADQTAKEFLSRCGGW
ncbi:uncharacterized protein LOC130740484 [Lotus japonicus]|uniref:uncharacterized protein LOC130740484 n=1 Tax=Lotus japonicus TaxID=34305 RepID=UPI0025834115|nr:uncharacterized protein LOC130740484 [Lotus japonicus]